MLKQELADLKAGRGLSAGTGEEQLASPSTAASPNTFSFPVESVPTVRTRPVVAAPPKPAPARNPPVVTPAATAPAAAKSAPSAAKPAGPRRHVVQPGDTLSKLAQQYYGNRAKWHDIYAANRGLMKSETDLKAGMELKIP